MMDEPAEKIEIHRGLKGLYFDRSRVCYIDGRNGELRYRGYSIHELAEHSTIEETCYLLRCAKSRAGAGGGAVEMKTAAFAAFAALFAANCVAAADPFTAYPAKA